MHTQDNFTGNLRLKLQWTVLAVEAFKWNESRLARTFAKSSLNKPFRVQLVSACGWSTICNHTGWCVKQSLASCNYDTDFMWFLWCVTAALHHVPACWAPNFMSPDYWLSATEPPKMSVPVLLHIATWKAQMSVFLWWCLLIKTQKLRETSVKRPWNEMLSQFFYLKKVLSSFQRHSTSR